MSRLLVGRTVSALVAVLISTAGCSGGSGSAPDGEAGSPGSGGSGGAVSVGGASGTAGAAAGAPASGGAPSSGIGGSEVGSGGGRGGAGPGGASATAGDGGMTGAAGAGGTTANGGAGGAIATGGAGGSGSKCLGNDIDLRATTVSGTVKVNGAVVTNATTQGAGSILLTNGEDSAVLGSTSATGGAYAVLVFPGTYDLYYSVSEPGTGVPNNAMAKLRSGIVVGASPLALDVDVPATKVSGAVTVNGAVVKGTLDTGLATVTLMSANGDAARLTNIAPSGAYSALVVAGTYDVYYGALGTGPLFPNNRSAKVQSGVVVGTSPLSLNIDIPAATVSVSITSNGAAVTGAAKGEWSLALKSAAGDRVDLATYSPSSGAYSGRVVPGTYDLYWTGGNADVLGHSSAKIKSGIVVGTSGASLSVDVPATTISGTVTLAGAAASVFGSGVPYLTLRGAAGDTVPLVITAAGAYSARVVPGSYDLYYRLAALDNNPRNSLARIQSAIIVGTTPVTLNIDIPATTVSGTVTINGAAITTSQRPFALTLQNAAGDSALLASYPQGGTYSASVIPGTYDLYYSRQGDIALTVPNNRDTKIRSGIVVGASPVALDVDIGGTTVAGAITVNGAANAGVAGDSAFVTLVPDEDDLAGVGLLTTATSATGTYSTFVLPGTYQLYYFRYRSSGNTLPANMNTHLGCFVVP
jgi:hypothetical protein